MSKTIVDFVSSHPYWPLRFLLVYLGNPIIFLSYLLKFSNYTSQDGVQIFGFKTFTVESTDFCRLNFVLFVVLTLPPYLLWFWIQTRIVGPLFCYMFELKHVLNVGKFCYHYAGVGQCVAAIPGLLNLLVWSTGRMKFMWSFLPLSLAIAVFFYVVLWVGGVGVSLDPQVPQDVVPLVTETSNTTRAEPSVGTPPRRRQWRMDRQTDSEDPRAQALLAPLVNDRCSP